MNNKRVVIAVFLFLAILMCMFTVRDSTIKEYDWRVTSGANLNNDFIYFFKDINKIFIFRHKFINSRFNTINSI